MAKKSDCICRPDDDGSILYNPRCRFHKGPDEGYGYDQWGQPNGKYSQRIGTIVAAVLIGLLLLAAIISVWQLVSRS